MAAPLAQRTQTPEPPDGVPEKVGTVIGNLVFAASLALVLWPIVRRFL
ncbi:hypothetical protein C7441_10443 [Pseudaminobacter salicylatoxidans]|uniref:Uncharacterized protein n=1 Tax=Pseudaminobacter salicylatoxidans TaxID=93369 RepID=A0A316C5G3_PSESE|nr:hypothetical protein [Pseudaminobacter salicylatoxidans]PWJ84778.1 hypothetical protein C7441_10443 [Pseudaminobacter salicylatoxidans]